MNREFIQVDMFQPGFEMNDIGVGDQGGGRFHQATVTDNGQLTITRQLADQV